MKTLLALLITFSCFSQIKHPDTDFYISENKVYWQHTYEFPDTKSDELLDQFLNLINSSLKFNYLKKSDNSISAEIIDDIPNYRKYGGSLLSVNYIASLYMNYNILAEFKENKYRVTVKNILIDNKQAGILKMNGTIEDFCTRNKSTEFKTGSNLNQGLIYDNNHFVDNFNVALAKQKKSDW